MDTESTTPAKGLHVATRRVVVAGRPSSTIISDGPPSRAHAMVNTPGLAQELLWATDAGSAGDGGLTADITESVQSLVPTPGNTRMLTITLPPDSVYVDPGYDPQAAGAEIAEHSPGLVECFEPDNPGMHTTPTFDYDVVLSGELWLDLGDGERPTHLRQGEVVILLGARHAWRNLGEAPATLLAVLHGVEAKA